MSKLDWAHIRNGLEFEALVGAVAVHGDPAARVLGAPEPDGAIDTLSGDGYTVIQAKYRRDWTVAELAQAARDEHEKIETYRASAHRHQPLWAGVRRWVLATNGERSAAAEARWKTEIEPLYAAAGLAAEWWPRETLEAKLLDEMPGLRRAYFQGEQRVFLTLPEIKPLLDANDRLDGAGWDAPPVGRDAARQSFGRFLDDRARFFAITGPGGSGKTRLLWQLGWDAIERGLDVWWVDPEALRNNSAWYDHVAPERPAVILIDEPPPTLLPQLKTQVLTRAKEWQIVVTARSEQDQVRRWFAAQTPPPTFLDLDPLTGDAATAAAQQLGGAQLDPDSARQIARLADGAPGWMAVAIWLVRDGHPLAALPDEPTALAADYLDRILDAVAARTGDPAERKRLLRLLRWLALLQPINAEDDGTSRLFASETGYAEAYEADDAVEHLVEAGLIVKRGRLRAIKPDVMADHVLRTWLVDASRANGLAPAAKPMLKALWTGAVPLLDHALQNLARLELLCALLDPPVDVRLLDGFADLLAKAAEVASISERLRLLALAKALRVSRPIAVARLVGVLRTSTAPDEVIEHEALGARTLQYDRVLRALPWALFEAAGYAKTADEKRVIFDELLALIALEASMPPGERQHLWFGGKKPSELLPRVVRGEAGDLSSYHPEALTEALRRLSVLMRAEPFDDSERLPLAALLAALLDIEFERTTYADGTLYFTRGVWPPEHPRRRERDRVRGALWDLLDAPGDVQRRRFIWEELTRSHCKANEVDGKHGAAVSTGAEVLDDLERALALMRSSIPTPREKLAARDLWRWHAPDDDPQRRSLAESCEEALWADPALQPYQAIEAGRVTDRPSGATQIAGSLACGSDDEIVQWIEGAFTLFGPEQATHKILSTVNALARADGAPVLDAARRLISSPGYPRALLAQRLVYQTLTRQREAPAALRAELDGLLAACPDDASRRTLVVDYSQCADDPPLAEELEWFDEWRRALWGDPRERATFFSAIGRLWPADIEGFISLAEKGWEDVPLDCVDGCFNSLMSAMLVHPVREVPPRLARWLLDQLVRVPDIGRYGIPAFRDAPATLDHTLAALTMSAHGHLPLDWMADLIATRAAQVSADDDEAEVRWSVLPHDFDFATLIDMDAASEETAERLLDLFCSAPFPDATVELWAPRHLEALDPDGQRFPPLIAKRVEAIPADAAIGDLSWPARLAKGWPEGSTPWRAIATPACAWADRQTDEQTRCHVWSVLYDGSSGVLLGREGFLNHIQSTAERLKHLHAEESDASLARYWAWRLKVEGSAEEAELQRLAEDEFSP